MSRCGWPGLERLLLAASLASTLGLGCAADATSPDAQTVAPSPDENTLRLTTHAIVTEPGDETIECEYLEPLAEDVWVTGYDTYQGPGGHHLVLFRPLQQKPAGTIEPCAEMDNALPVLSPTESEHGHAEVRFPEDTALRIKAGTQLIMQAHYVNASTETTSFVDVADLHTVPSGEGLKTLHVYAGAPLTFSVPPGGSERVGFDCELPYDMTFVLLLGHMHEYGDRFYAMAGEPSAMEMMLKVPKWTPSMRDLPPSARFYSDAERAAGTFSKGDRQRTICAWNNTSEHTLEFPEEMCASFGYFYSDDPAADDHVCAANITLPEAELGDL